MDYDIQMLCEAVILSLCEDYGEAPITVKLDGRLGKSLGWAQYNKRTILINPIIVHNWNVLEDTLKHEFAHFLALKSGDTGHGEIWKDAAKTVGANPSAVQPWDSKDVKANSIRWLYECGQGCKFYYNRKARNAERPGAICTKHRLPLTRKAV